MMRPQESEQIPFMMGKKLLRCRLSLMVSSADMDVELTMSAESVAYIIDSYIFVNFEPRILKRRFAP